MYQDKEPSKPIPVPDHVKFLFGVASGMMAICVVQPADLMKTRMQLLGPTATDETLCSVAKEIIRCHGYCGFYAGISAALLRQAMYSSVRIASYTAMNEYYINNYLPIDKNNPKKRPKPSIQEKVMFGALAGAVGAAVTNPAEVALIRMTADARLPKPFRKNYTNVFNALGRIMSEEGMQALWRGLSTSIARSMVVNAAYFGSYKQAKEMLRPSMSQGVPLHICSSMIAALVTTWVSLPLDIVKTRVQNSSSSLSERKVFLNIIRHEGTMALWNGFLPTFAKLGPHTVLTFVFMEQWIALYRAMYTPPPPKDE